VSFADGVHQVEISCLVPPSSGEKVPNDLTKYFLDALLEFMVLKVRRVVMLLRQLKIYLQFSGLLAPKTCLFFCATAWWNSCDYAFQNKGRRSCQFKWVAGARKFNPRPWRVHVLSAPSRCLLITELSASVLSLVILSFSFPSHMHSVGKTKKKWLSNASIFCGICSRRSTCRMHSPISTTAQAFIRLV